MKYQPYYFFKKAKYQPCIISLIFLFFISELQAQVFGGNPSSLKWKQVNTSSARIIFPEGADSIAQQAAAGTEYIQQHFLTSGGSEFKKINIVLQDQTMTSNGYVALAPWRSEFYLMPPQNPFELGAQSWANLLTTHEWRHVQQYNYFNRGNAKFFGALFGQYARATANAAAIPDWFFEGDAVYNETRLSTQGRGRLPFFFNGYKTILHDSLKYNYMQLRNGSYKNYIPDHYQLGYMLVLYGIEKYGTDFWEPILQEASALKTFYPLQSAMKKIKGIEFNVFADDALKYFQNKWQQEEKADPGNMDEVILAPYLEPNNRIRNYRYPYPVHADTFVVYKATQQDIPAFYFKTVNGFEKKIAVKDISDDGYYSYNNGQIVYTAMQPDARWGNRDYTFIKLLNIYTHEEKEVTGKGKYFSPDIAHTKDMIIVVDMDINKGSRLIALNTKGTVIKEFNNEGGYIYSHPKFSVNDDALIVMIRDKAGQMGIQKISIETGKAENILPLENRVIGFPVVKGDTLTYTSSYKGRDALMAMDIKTHNRWLLAYGITGIYQGIFADAGKLVTSVFTDTGYQLKTAKPLWKPLQQGEDNLQLLYTGSKINQQVSTPLPGANTAYTAQPYKKSTGLFNFHSWLPAADDPEYSFTLYGQNIFNTMQTQLGYVYNRNDDSHEIFYRNVYGGWYLQPFWGANYTFHRTSLYGIDTTLIWNEAEARVGLQLPLNFSKGKTFQRLFFSSSFTVNNRKYDEFSKTIFSDRNVIYSDNRINYSIFSQQAPQQVLPRLGFTLSLRSRHAVNTVANNFTGTVAAYFPGLLKTHSLSINYSYLHRDTLRNFSYSKVFPFSRGYDYVDLGRLSKFGFNYQLPLFYPDFGFGNLLFINRIRLNAFAESTKSRNQRTQRVLSYKTIGSELYFDTKWFNQQALTFGVRYSYLLNADKHLEPTSVVEFILPVIITP